MNKAVAMAGPNRWMAAATIHSRSTRGAASTKEERHGLGDSAAAAKMRAGVGGGGIEVHGSAHGARLMMTAATMMMNGSWCGRLNDGLMVVEVLICRHCSVGLLRVGGIDYGVGLLRLCSADVGSSTGSTAELHGGFDRSRIGDDGMAATT
ncbi:hypothetical protein M0R45_012283 [Rubus argutus]|uniref:Uncharacterized protein n=1 Tax=Rubus argutus TaxID=59490 RepID=A0AAW1YE67_RUBAR